MVAAIKTASRIPGLVMTDICASRATRRVDPKQPGRRRRRSASIPAADLTSR
jgi:hypothetical protein